MEGIVRIDGRFSVVARFAPDRDALQQAAQEGFRSVVNMSSREEKQELPPDEERRWVEAAGLTYLHHPVSADHLLDELVDASAGKQLICLRRCWSIAPPGSAPARWS